MLPEDISVAEKLNEIYCEHEYEEDCCKAGYDSNSKYVMETEAIERAHRHLEMTDRKNISMMTDTLVMACGKQFGPKSAHQVLARLGIFFMMTAEGK